MRRTRPRRSSRSLCVWVTLIFCEFGGAVAHGRSVTTAVLSVGECGFCLVGCVCEREREGERQRALKIVNLEEGRRRR